jgi:hypothetical protein
LDKEFTKYIVNPRTGQVRILIEDDGNFSNLYLNEDELTDLQNCVNGNAVT